MTSTQRSRILSDDLAIHDANIVARFHLGDGCERQESLHQAPTERKQGCTVAVCTYKRATSLDRFLESLQTQDRKPDQLIIVDASPDDETEQVVKNRQSIKTLADCVLYFRVSGPLKGLTRQRNFALRWVTTDIVAFFDDDVALLPSCLREMEQAQRLSGDEVVGVGGFSLNHYERPPFLWRLRRSLGIVSNLQPGRYCRSGIAIPWSLLGQTEETIEGNWLSGCAMMWKTSAACEVGFNELFSLSGGYSNGEDLEFSLRMNAKGKILLAGKAHLWHLHDLHGSSNWADAYQLAYTGIHNAYYIHRHCLTNRTWKDAAWFMYAQGLDTLIRCSSLIRPGRTLEKWLYIKGRLDFFAQLLRLRPLRTFQSIKPSEAAQKG